MFVQRLISSLFLWALIIVLAVWRLSHGMFILVAVIGLLAQWEFYQLQKRKGLRVFAKLGTGFGILYFAASYCEIWQLGLDTRALEGLLFLALILAALTRQIFEDDQSTPVVTIALTCLGFFYVPFLFCFMENVIFWGGLEMQHIFIALYLVAVTKFTDVGAYITGKLLGKHPMIPRISPKKTWEGFAGGTLLAFAIGMGLLYFFPQELILLKGRHGWFLSLAVPLISVIGDLAESVIKRDADIKDSGDIIPGIGGVLDLIDSLLFTAPFFYAYLLLFVRG